MGSDKWDFDKKAASWDKNPARVKLAKDIADTISGQGILSHDMDVLDFGCGTGLLSLRLRPMVRSVTGVDSSRGMLEVFNSKIENQHLTNVKTQYLSTGNADALEGSYDVIVCGMTLHHVEEIRPLLDQFHKIIAPRGYLVIADLDPDNGQFHGDNDTVFHCGFDRTVLHQTLIEIGFDEIRDLTAANMMKRSSDGIMRSFTVFLMISWKRH